MQLTTDHSIVFPVTMPREVVKFISQILTLDIEILLTTQMKKYAKDQTDEKKEEVDKKEREFSKEKFHLTSELERIVKKRDKIDEAISRFLIKILKFYKPKTDVNSLAEMGKKLLFSYRDESGSCNLIDLFDESKDDSYDFTPEQKDFLKFARSQDEAKIHYANKLENNKKGDEINLKIQELNKRLGLCKEEILDPYNQAIKHYNSLKSKLDDLLEKKEYLSTYFLKMLENDSSIKVQIEQWVGIGDSDNDSP
jgi:hypothetical protein